jgi:drug/metabolite transporter (DMT)-like permease
MLAGMLLGLAASASWALANVVVQRAGRAVGALRGLLWAQVVGIALSALGAAAYDDRTAALTPALGGWIAVAGISALLAYFCLFYAFEHGRLTLAVPIMSSWAVIASALSLVLFHERLTVAELVGAAAVIAGAIVVSRHAQRSEPAPGGTRSRWLLAAVGAAVGFGVLIPAMRRMSPVFGSMGTIGAVYVADLALALPLAIGVRGFRRFRGSREFRIDLRPPNGRAWLPVVLAGFLETAGSVCIVLGARYAPLTIVSPLASLAAAFTVLYAWAVLGERPARGVLVGAILVSIGVVVLAL